MSSMDRSIALDVLTGQELLTTVSLALHRGNGQLSATGLADDSRPLLDAKTLRYTAFNSLREIP